MLDFEVGVGDHQAEQVHGWENASRYKNSRCKIEEVSKISPPL